MANIAAFRESISDVPDVTRTAVSPAASIGPTRTERFTRWFLVVALIYLLISAVSVISSGFRTATGDQAEELFQFATNPFIGLVVGIIATALIQSSSTVTSIIVGLVAGGLPVSVAVPMVMGANIGTTVTNTLVSLGFVREKEEFKRAFSAATVHDFFNLLAVAIFLPLEIMFGFLERVAVPLAEPLSGSGDYSVDDANLIGMATSPIKETATGMMSFLPSAAAGIGMVLIGTTMIFMAIRYLGKLLKKLLVGRAQRVLNTAIGRGPVSGMVSGATATVLVQSSTTSTCLMIPLAGSGALSLRQIYPFTIGANLGTTMTALLASTAATGPLAVHALEIALVHLLFNIFAMVVIFALPLLRNVPIRGAEWLAALALKNKTYAIAWVVVTFLAVPALLILASALL
ncbi:Na/Pi cotransporter family protein [Actinobacteria bacterium YIM 96077]|uniref:Na/Pi cotransporter family protein n=1 Tax=Phytoactinopolyspora halophila TaxID=1981511 RepID=A0A329R4D1_9ACTN|nr:Na/Pi symporter [Phytoactinopolyspora halophila]AYY11568.1 Na/Pi cotransporter family protein [Actinobacteria bacterium YIM 96077]RAW17948.1 Na/Pi cotransporter family protein [Phytoactinopolyspora halophila]